MPSLYAQYILEREGRHCIETEEGYATYDIRGQECHLVDIYVIPTHRKNGIASELADRVANEAKDRGCKYLLGSVVPTANGATDSLKALLAYKMQLLKADVNFIWLAKEI